MSECVGENLSLQRVIFQNAKPDIALQSKANQLYSQCRWVYDTVPSCPYKAYVCLPSGEAAISLVCRCRDTCVSQWTRDSQTHATSSSRPEDDEQTGPENGKPRRPQRQPHIRWVWCWMSVVLVLRR